MSIKLSTSILKDTHSDAVIDGLATELHKLKQESKISLALLYGSYAKGTQHSRSDIDVAIYFNTESEKETIEVMDRILMSSESEISILQLNDRDESPFVVQEALRGINLVEPDMDKYYEVAHWALHEAESIRFRRGMNG